MGYDLDADPCEYTDIKADEPEIYEMMYQLLISYNESAVTPTLYQLFPNQVNASDPAQFGGYWSPWIDLTENVDVAVNEDELMEYDERRIGMATAKMIDVHHMIALIIVAVL